MAGESEKGKRFRDWYPGPWQVEENGGGWSVRDKFGAPICYIHCDERDLSRCVGAVQPMPRRFGLALAKRIAALGEEG